MHPYFEEAWASVARFITSSGLSVLSALAIVVVGWIFARWAGRAARRLAERSAALGPTLAPILGKAARLAVVAFIALAALDALGIDTTGMLAALGALGLGVGLALKDTLADLAGGIVLLVLRPFDVGDSVDLGGVEGTIDSIDLFETKLTGFDGVPMMVTNRKVRDGRIKNYSRAASRRVDLEVGIAYEADVDAAVAVLQRMLADDERVLAEPTPLVATTALADSSVNLLVRVWLEPATWFPTSLDLRRKIKLALDEADISIPFPQRDVHVIERKSAA